jgi:hypothetical protein
LTGGEGRSFSYLWKGGDTVHLTSWDDIAVKVGDPSSNGRFLDIVLTVECPVCRHRQELILGSGADAWMWPLDGRIRRLEEQPLFKELAKYPLYTCKGCGVPSALDESSQEYLKKYFHTCVTSPAASPRR